MKTCRKCKASHNEKGDICKKCSDEKKFNERRQQTDLNTFSNKNRKV